MNQSEKALAHTLLKPNITRLLPEKSARMAEKQMTRLFTNTNVMDIEFDDILTILEEITKLKDGTLELKFQNHQLTKIKTRKKILLNQSEI